MSGTSGTSGVSITGPTGPTGAAGSGGSSTIYNNTSRYQAYNSTQEAWIVSSATVNTGLSWTRSLTTLTITHNSHGRSNGDLVIIRNANADNFSGIISNASANTFDVTTANSGTSSGSSAAYSAGFTLSSVTSGGATIVAPSGCDVQLLGIYFYTGTRTSNAGFSLTLPTSAVNGSGNYSGTTNSFFPIIRGQDMTANPGTVLSLTMNQNTTTNYNVYALGGLGSNTNAAGLRFSFS